MFSAALPHSFFFHSKSGVLDNATLYYSVYSHIESNKSRRPLPVSIDQSIKIGIGVSPELLKQVKATR